MCSKYTDCVILTKRNGRDFVKQIVKGCRQKPGKTNENSDVR